MTIPLPLSTPCLVSLTEWTVLDHIGFERPVLRSKIHAHNLIGKIFRQGMIIARPQTGPQGISSNFAHADVKDEAPHFSQRRLEGVD